MPHGIIGATERSPKSNALRGGIDDSLEAMAGSRVVIKPNGCWAYLDDLDRYHRIAFRGAGAKEPVPAHRWFYETLVDTVPHGMVVHHTCENKGCVNPEHLQPLTPTEHAIEHARLRRLAA